MIYKGGEISSEPGHFKVVNDKEEHEKQLKAWGEKAVKSDKGGKVVDPPADDEVDLEKLKVDELKAILFKDHGLKEEELFKGEGKKKAPLSKKELIDLIVDLDEEGD